MSVVHWTITIIVFAQDNIVVARIFPYYVCTILFLMPYLAAVTYYPLEVSFYIDKVR